MDKSKVFSVDTVYFKSAKSSADVSTQEHIYSQLDNTKCKELPVYANSPSTIGNNDGCIEKNSACVIIAISVAACLISNVATGLSVYYTTGGSRGCDADKNAIIDGKTTIIPTTATFTKSDEMTRIWASKLSTPHESFVTETTTTVIETTTTVAKDTECSCAKDTLKPFNVSIVDVKKFCLSFPVFCEKNINGSDWIVFQRRESGSVDFYRNWEAYKNGFGDPAGEFWLGNDNIHALTSAGFNELRIDMTDFDGHRAYAEYSNFSINSENESYTLHISGYRGNAGDSLSYHNGMLFSTKDRDNDNSTGSCCSSWGGAWWYRSCHKSHLNGFYYSSVPAPFSKGINWFTWRGFEYSLKFVEMKIGINLARRV